MRRPLGSDLRKKAAASGLRRSPAHFAARWLVLATAATALCLHTGALAQTQKAPDKPAADAKAPAVDPRLPAPEQLIVLIRSTLAALAQANLTGNYTVLRDLAAPPFQAANSAADLSAIFTSLRRQQVDLFATLAATPELTSGPTIDQNGLLRLGGFFPTQPVRVTFDMLFQPVNGQWRLVGISVNPPPAQSPAAQSPTASGEQAPAGNAAAQKKTAPKKAPPQPNPP